MQHTMTELPLKLICEAFHKKSYKFNFVTFQHFYLLKPQIINNMPNKKIVKLLSSKFQNSYLLAHLLQLTSGL